MIYSTYDNVNIVKHISIKIIKLEKYIGTENMPFKR